MPRKHIWMVRAGDYNELVGDFWDKGKVAIGWSGSGDWSGLNTREDFKKSLADVHPEWSAIRIGVAAGQCYRFAREIQVGDYVISYDKARREYIAGEIDGGYRYAPDDVSPVYPHTRNVKWIRRIPRDVFTVPVKNSLGSTLTVFRNDKHFEELQWAIKSEAPTLTEEEELGDVDKVEFYDEVKEQADELISDALSKIDPLDFEELVAAVLRAMGFRTVVIPPGPDRGVDIIAHPDAFGFQTPRIKVQVKHRTSTAGGPDLRNFIATLKDGENGLFVSSGGFTRDAENERERAIRPIKIMDRDGFVDLLIEHYENLEPEYKALIPLKKAYIPTGV